MYALSSSNDDDDGRYRRVADYAEFCKFVEPLAYSIVRAFLRCFPLTSSLGDSGTLRTRLRDLFHRYYLGEASPVSLLATEKASAQIGVRRCQVAR